MNKAAIRASDIFLSLLGLIILFPLILIIALAIRLDSAGPILFRQIRVGKNNSDFTLLKFRSMHLHADRKGLITIGAKDPRVTRVGHFLRKFKLDELPQLINVLKGEMSLVGPRPEVRQYTEKYTPAQRMIVLSVKPGITDNASIAFARENELLSKQPDPEAYYENVIVPGKIKLNLLFIEKYTYGHYLNIIFRTIVKLIIR